MGKSLPELRFAKINALKETNAKKKFEIRGYPVLVLMLGDSRLYYAGERSFRKIEKWLRARMDPPIKEVVSVEEAERLEKRNKIFLAFFP